MEYKNKIVVITGAASGIGYELSKRFVEKGSRVYSFDVLLPVKRVKGVEYFEVDITDPEKVEGAYAQIGSAVDVLVNNAGVLKRGYFYETEDEDFDLMLDVNLKGPWLMHKYGKKYLRDDAMIVQISTKNALNVSTHTAIYTLSKFALTGLSRVIQKTMQNLDIRTAYMGRVDTQLLWEGLNEAEKIEKKKVTISPEAAVDKIIELIESDKKDLMYDLEENKYYLQ